MPALHAHISVDSKKRGLLTSSCGEGVIESYPLHDDATPFACIINFSTLKGKDRMKNVRKKHTLTSLVSRHRMKRFIAVVDLGIDKVLTYKIHNGVLGRSKQLICCSRHDGPRHLTFHPKR